MGFWDEKNGVTVEMVDWIPPGMTTIAPAVLKATTTISIQKCSVLLFAAGWIYQNKQKKLDFIAALYTYFVTDLRW